MEYPPIIEAPELVQLAEKVLPQPIKDDLLAYCPSMDLLAIVTADEHVQILRLNGQKVISVASKRGCSPLKLCWKPNGSLLAIAYSDNSLSLIASQGGKIVHQIHCPVGPATKISALGWGVSFTDATGIHSLLNADSTARTSTLSLDDVVYRGFAGELTQPKLDLPSDLASVDVESVLPKLSVLPPGGKEGEVFTTRTTIDSLFHSKKGRSSSADALIVAFDDGSAWLSVHDLFEVGRFDPKQIAPGKGFTIIRHAYHPFSSTQGLLLSRAAQDQDEIYFAPLDLRLIGSSAKQFSLLASKSTQLLNVLRYAKECQVQIYNEFTASQTLPQRFIANAEEDLQEKEQTDFKTAVYHLVATGDCSPIMKEWLVDQLGDRGQKRWEKAASSGYENTRKLLHENLLPALDRVSVLLNRLKGFAAFQETATAFGLTTLEVDHALDTLKCLHLLGHSALISTDDELRKSVAFCGWLKQEIDVQASDATHINPDEADKEPSFDYADIFDYIESTLQRSMLYEFFDIKHESDARETVDMPSENDSMYHAYKDALQKSRRGQRLQKRLPGLEALLERLQKQCAIIFGNIAETQQRKVRFGEPLLIGSSHADRLDMRMLVEKPADPILTFVAIISADQSQAKIIRLILSTTNNVSSLSEVAEAHVSAKPDGKIFDLRFTDDTTLCVGLTHQDKSRLLMIPFHGEQPALTFSAPNTASNSSKETLELLDRHVQDAFTHHIFKYAGASALAPAKIEVNGRKGRRALCVVAQDNMHYRIFDVDSSTDTIHGEGDGDASLLGGDEDIVMVH